MKLTPEQKDMLYHAKRFFIFLIIAIVIFLAGADNGKTAKQNEIEARALATEEKEAYNWQEIEIIVHGEIQE